jgi:kynurenine formamidase
MMKVRVADIVLGLDLPDRFLRGDMAKFRVDHSEREDVSIRMSNERFPSFSASDAKGIQAHSVHCVGNDYYYLMSADDFVTHIQFNRDYSHFTIHLSKDDGEQDERAQEFSIECVNSALRRIFIMSVAQKGGICLHASTIRWNGGAICFSAGSGTGKTTHTNLWREVIPGVEVLNGDKGYVLFKEGTAYFYSAPWCGTSGECMNTAAPVKAVVFLEQAKENAIERMGVPEAFMRLTARCFLPSWDKSLYLNAIDAAESLAGAIDCYHLRCLPDREAARVCYHGVYQQ